MTRHPVKAVWQRAVFCVHVLGRLPGLLLIVLVRGYRYFVSPLFPPTCRFVPTCSQYAIEAIKKHGALRGGVMALWRILRCHPFSRGGYDPVL